MKLYDTIGKPALLLADRIGRAALTMEAPDRALTLADALVCYALWCGGAVPVDLRGILGGDVLEALRDHEGPDPAPSSKRAAMGRKAWESGDAERFADAAQEEAETARQLMEALRAKD